MKKIIILSAVFMFGFAGITQAVSHTHSMAMDTTSHPKKKKTTPVNTSTSAAATATGSTLSSTDIHTSRKTKPAMLYKTGKSPKKDTTTNQRNKGKKKTGTMKKDTAKH